MNLHKKLKICFFFLCVFVCFRHGGASCGYESCHPVKQDHINIHLVPHTHDDMGWLKTVDQYYYGTHKEASSVGVQFILDSLVDALQKNSERRFIYVEMGFFFKWWVQQKDEIKSAVKNLVNNGQLEFISGGWSMNDEATTYYQTIIDQMSVGLRRLNETFGECGRPKAAWQIDPFGHSREMASIFAQLGFDGFFLNRIHYQDMDARKLNRSMEFVWRGSPDNLGESTDIYSNVLFRHYSAPSGLCFDILCNEEPIVDDINTVEYNVKQKAENFINDWVVPASQVYASNNVLVPLGDDFNYQYAQQYFDNIDKLIKYINERETFDGVSYNVIYSTPSCYLNAVYQATNGTLEAPLKTDDFFPLASNSHYYWTGYFTSRPTGKGYSRYANNFLQVCKQLNALTNVSSDEAELNVLREALGVFQHHDAITGTEKENVAKDYYKSIHNGIVKCEESANKMLFNLVGSTDMTFTTCPGLNVSECARTENEETLVITVYNPLARSVNKYVRVPIVDNITITVTDPAGEQLITQVVPVPPQVLNIPGRDSQANFELIFLAENVPPLGFKSYFFEKSSGEKIDDNNNYDSSQGTINTGFGDIKVRSGVTTAQNLHTNELDLSVGIFGYYYTGFVGDDSSDELTSSSQYIFRPDPDIPLQPVTETYNWVTYFGPLLVETHWNFTEWFSYVERSYSSTPRSIEFNYLVGPLPLNQGKGIEVILKYNTDIEYNDNIYMDTNGRETIERTRQGSLAEPTAGNYYPVVSGASIRNPNGTAQITILTDRANGGGSVDYQNIEFMVHRNTINSLGGVQNIQASDSEAISRGTHYLMFGGTDYVSASYPTPQEVSQEIYLDSWIFFASPNGLSFEAYQQSHIMEFSGLANVTLPRNVHILTLEPWGQSTLLLRLENFVGKEDSWHSGTSTVDVKELFSTFDVNTMKETTLGGNQWLEENNRIRFNLPNGPEEKTREDEDDFSVTLDPMQIRTFILTVTYK